MKAPGPPRLPPWGCLPPPAFPPPTYERVVCVRRRRCVVRRRRRRRRSLPLSSPSPRIARPPLCPHAWRRFQGMRSIATETEIPMRPRAFSTNAAGRRIAPKAPILPITSWLKKIGVDWSHKGLGKSEGEGGDAPTTHSVLGPTPPPSRRDVVVVGTCPHLSGPPFDRVCVRVWGRVRGSYQKAVADGPTTVGR